jgi:large subunit ribosomal protein L15
MNLSDLKPPKGATSYKKRLGRGLGSGLGKTSGKGHKGQRARSSGNVRPGFEGGQMPLYRRIPKFGFKNPFRTEYQPVNVRDLEQAAKHASGVVDAAAFKKAGLIHHESAPVKILGTGELKAKLTVKANAFSAEAKKKIEAAGGKVDLIAKVEPKPVVRHKNKQKPAK